MVSSFFYKYRPQGNFHDFRIDNFLFIFNLFYLLLTLFGYFFIDFISISLKTYIIFTFYTLLISFGAFIGLRIPNVTYSKIRLNHLNLFNYFIVFCFSIAIIYAWSILINRYGSIKNIIAGAYLIRIENIGKSTPLMPISISYFLSLPYAFFSLNLALYGITLDKKYIILSIILFVIITLSDLMLFGRIGILYAIFSYIGFLLVFKRSVFTFKKLFLVISLYSALMLPRLIRGSFDNFKATIQNISPYFKFNISPFFYSFISVYIYFFGSLFALSDFLSKEFQYTYGWRLFTPFYNIFVRIFNVGTRKNLIDKSALIPYESNIFTIIKDIISDFGYIGLLIMPLFFGIIIGHIFKNNHQSIFFKALKIYMFGWIFYTPIYNAFSFGGFFISFVFLLFFAYFLIPSENNLR